MGGQKPFGGAEQISQLGMSLTPSGLPISFFPIEAGRIVIVLVSLLRRRALSYDGAFPDCHLFVKGRRLEFISNGSAGDSQHVTSVYASLPTYRSSYFYLVIGAWCLCWCAYPHVVVGIAIRHSYLYYQYSFASYERRLHRHSVIQCLFNKLDQLQILLVEGTCSPIDRVTSIS